MPVIAVDAMGGDLAPEEIVKGVADASLATAIECVLVGDEPRIQAVLDTVSYDPAHSRIHHASDAVGMQEAPREALRAKRDASIRVGASIVAWGRRRLVSAGNTGACLLACAREFRSIKGCGSRRSRAYTRGTPTIPGRINWRSCSTSGRRCAARPSTSCSSRSWGASMRSGSRRWRGRASRSSTWAPSLSRVATCSRRHTSVC